MRTILLDCDDVLLNWLDGFRAHIMSKLGRDICEHGPEKWAMHDWLGVDEHDVPAHIADFNSSPLFGNLDPIDGAVRMIGALSETADLHVITSCSSDDDTWNMRHENLKRHFGPVFSSLECLSLGQSKAESLARYSGNVVWVEDNLRNALLGVELGHRTYLRRTSHNARFEPTTDKRITWFSHWDELNPERL